MLNTYYFDLDSGKPFSILETDYYFDNISGLIKPITGSSYAGKYSFDYVFRKNIVIKNIRFKILGLEGCRIYGDSQLCFRLFKQVLPFTSPNNLAPKYFDYNLNKWITSQDIENNPYLDIENTLLCNIYILEFDNSYPLNIELGQNTANNKLLFSYGLIANSGSNEINYSPILKIDTTNADASYNGRPVTLRAFIEVEE